MDKITALLLRQFPYEPTDGQRKLLGNLSAFLLTAKERPCFVLKGYAGTGKTTIVSAMVKVLPRISLKPVLLAPTGRAAKVLSQYSGLRAFTIHKKIYRPATSKDGMIKLSLMPNPHKNTVFVVDEASMIPDQMPNREAMFSSSRSLLEDLVQYVFSGENNRLLLLGDTAQLPPVGSSDSPALNTSLLRNGMGLTAGSVELTDVVRQAKDSAILVNATLIREKIRTGSLDPPYFRILTKGSVHKVDPSEVEDLLHSCFSREKMEHSVVITRSNRRANLFNQGIRNRVLFREEEIETGDYLMVVRNNYFWLPPESSAGFIANGDVVEIMRIRKRTEVYGFHFAQVQIRLVDYPEEKELDVLLMLDTLHTEAASLSGTEYQRLFQALLVDYQDIGSKRGRMEAVRNNPFFNALQVKFSYALTCHKTQGGQWEHVVVDQGYLKDDMIDIEYLRWLYTAVTRAYGSLYLVNFRETFFQEILQGTNDSN